MRLFHLAFWTTALVLTASAARATVVAEDNFGYPNGTLDGKNGGSGLWTSPWSNLGLDAVSGQAVTNTFANPPKYISRAYTNPAATTEFFVSFDITTPSAFVTSDYFAIGLTIGANNPILTAGKGSNSDNWVVGVLGQDSGIPISPGQTYRIVAGVAYRHDPVPVAQLLWINPDASDFYDPVTGNSSADFVAHDVEFFHSATITVYSNLAGVKFDNLVLSDTFQDAIPSACPGDVNGDGKTNVADFNILASHFAQAVPPNTNGDLTGDGFVNVADFNILAGDFGCL